MLETAGGSSPGLKRQSRVFARWTQLLGCGDDDLGGVLRLGGLTSG